MKAKYIIFFIVLFILFRKRAGSGPAYVNANGPTLALGKDYQTLLRDQNDRYAQLVADYDLSQVLVINSIDTLVLPSKRKGFILATNDTNFSEEPKKQMYYNDGTALVKGDLYAIPFDKLSNTI